MTTTDLLERALQLACQIPELHEISYHMGRADEVVPEELRDEFRRGQAIMAEATGLAIELERALAAPLTPVQQVAKDMA